MPSPCIVKCVVEKLIYIYIFIRARSLSATLFVRRRQTPTLERRGPVKVQPALLFGFTFYVSFPSSRFGNFILPQQVALCLMIDRIALADARARSSRGLPPRRKVDQVRVLLAAGTNVAVDR